MSSTWCRVSFSSKQRSGELRRTYCILVSREHTSKYSRTGSKGIPELASVFRSKFDLPEAVSRVYINCYY